MRWCFWELAGCGKTDPPQFRLNMVAIARQQLPREQQQEVANILEAMYGTPDEPFVLADTRLDIKKIRMAAGPVQSDQFGNETGLYRRHCGHCHGTTGDGLGPTALLLNPYPRDYRQGKFKFKSTERRGQADRRTIWSECSATACKARPCPRSTCCPTRRSRRWSST